MSLYIVFTPTPILRYNKLYTIEWKLMKLVHYEYMNGALAPGIVVETLHFRDCSQAIGLAHKPIYIRSAFNRFFLSPD